MGLPGGLVLTRALLGGRQGLAKGLASAAGWVEVHGMYGSPYTRKVQAALRYKQVSCRPGVRPLRPGGLHAAPADARGRPGKLKCRRRPAVTCRVTGPSWASAG
jgi:hypothetical protein